MAKSYVAATPTALGQFLVIVPLNLLTDEKPWAVITLNKLLRWDSLSRHESKEQAQREVKKMRYWHRLLAALYAKHLRGKAKDKAFAKQMAKLDRWEKTH
jgi:hypothetical protein